MYQTVWVYAVKLPLEQQVCRYLEYIRCNVLQYCYYVHGDLVVDFILQNILFNAKIAKHYVYHSLHYSSSIAIDTFTFINKHSHHKVKINIYSYHTKKFNNQ